MFQILATPLGDDSTAYVVGDNVDQVISALRNHTGSLFSWFSDNQMKKNPYQCLINEKCEKEIKIAGNIIQRQLPDVFSKKKCP